MVPLYTMEAVRNFQAMDSDCNIIKGETLTLILDNQKFCLVHRRDDLPFVVPNSYVSLQTPTEEKRPRSFPKFPRERKLLRNRQKYPISTFNLESVCPQFATVTDPFAATSSSEVDLLKDTAVLILNADPQSLYWFGVTPHGTSGLLPKNNVSMITQKGTPSLQQGCRLTAHTRKAYSTNQPHEVSVSRGWNLEIIGMPEMWRWQVRLSQSERKVGLLPVHVLSEVITCPEDGVSAEITSPLQDIAQSTIGLVRSPFMMDPRDVDSKNLAPVMRTGEETPKRRQSSQNRPLSKKPADSRQSLNDLNRPTEGAPRYVNGPQNHRSLGSQEPQALVSDEAAVPRRLEGVSALDAYSDLADDGDYYDTLPSSLAVQEGGDLLDKLERMIKIIHQDHDSLKKSQAENQRRAHQWEQTVTDMCRLVGDAHKTAKILSRSQTDLRNQYYDCPYDMGYIRDGAEFSDRSRDRLRSNDVVDWRIEQSREEFLLEDMEGDRYNTMPQNKPASRVHRRSLAHPSPVSQIREEEAEKIMAQLTRASSQPLLEVRDEYESRQIADLVSIRTGKSSSATPNSFRDLPDASISILANQDYSLMAIKRNHEFLNICRTASEEPGIKSQSQDIAQSTMAPVRPSSMMNPRDMDPTNLVPVIGTGEETPERRQSSQNRPLSKKPADYRQSLNDPNRPTEGAPRYVNGLPNRSSLGSQEPSLPQALVTDEAAIPRRLEGVSALGACRSDLADDGDYNDTLPSSLAVQGGGDLLDKLERMVKIICQDHDSLEKSQAENQRRAHQWEQTVTDMCRLVGDAHKTAKIQSRSQTDLRSQYYHDYPYDMGYIQDRAGFSDRSRDRIRSNDVVDWRMRPFREEFPLGDMDGDKYNTVPQSEPATRVHGKSLAHPSPVSQTREKEEGAEEMTARLTRASSKPLLDVKDVYESSQMAEFVFMSPQLSDENIASVVDIVCPVTAMGPQLHWKPILVSLGLREDTARNIAQSQSLGCREQWKKALIAWRGEMGDEAMRHLFLEKVRASGHQDLYEKIVAKCTFRAEWDGCPRLMMELYSPRHGAQGVNLRVSEC